MYLARDKYGNIGRQIPGASMQAQIAPMHMGESPGNVQISSAAQIDQAQAERLQKIRNSKARRDQKRHAEQARAQQAQILSDAQARKIAQFQGAKKFDPVNEQLKAYFARKKQMGSSSSDQVALSVSATSGAVFKPVGPADASNSGANMHIVPDNRPVEPVIWQADFRTHMIKGNPLTRDGRYGPAVTDYDRFVQGTDVNDQNMGRVSGNTIYGRREGLGRATTLDRALKGFSGMGDDIPYSDPTSIDDQGMYSEPPASVDTSAYDNSDISSEDAGYLNDMVGDSSPGFFDKVWDQSKLALDTALPAVIKSQMMQALSSGKTVTTRGNVMTISSPGTTPVKATIPGAVPMWALYGAAGVFGLVALKILTKK